MPSYSFILTAYKGAYLKEAIESILAQSYTRFELVVVDDASPDNLEQIVGAFSDERLSYIKHEQNTGGHDLVGHWNNCLAYTHADYVILASDDDTYDIHFLEEVDRMVRLYPQTQVLCARARFVDNDGRIITQSPSLKPLLSPQEYLDAFEHEVILSSLQNHVFKRSALMDIGGFVNFPLAWHTDDATVLALSLHSVAYSKDVLFTFRSSGINISSLADSPRTLTLKLQARNDFYRWLQTHYLPLLAADAHTHMPVLRNKLRHLTFTMLFNADSSVAWASRKAFASSDYLTLTEFYKAFGRKIFLNHIYLFDIRRWMKKIRDIVLLR